MSHDATQAVQRVLAYCNRRAEVQTEVGVRNLEGADIIDTIQRSPWDLTESDLRTVLKQLADANTRADSATVLHDRWQALIAERDAAVGRAGQAEAKAERRFHQCCRLVATVQHAYYMNHLIELEPGETPPTIADVWAQVREIADRAEQQRQDFEEEL